jgi:hypothetical protein
MVFEVTRNRIANYLEIGPGGCHAGFFDIIAIITNADPSEDGYYRDHYKHFHQCKT